MCNLSHLQVEALDVKCGVIGSTHNFCSSYMAGKVTHQAPQSGSHLDPHVTFVLTPKRPHILILFGSGKAQLTVSVLNLPFVTFLEHTDILQKLDISDAIKQ
jgi:hypothetical protein